MSKRKIEKIRKKHGLDREMKAIEFLSCLEANEEVMGEGAAMAVTCEIYGLEMHDGYELLADHPDMVEVKP